MNQAHIEDLMSESRLPSLLRWVEAKNNVETLDFQMIILFDLLFR